MSPREPTSQYPLAGRAVELTEAELRDGLAKAARTRATTTTAEETSVR
jgi:hypothetical protein